MTTRIPAPPFGLPLTGAALQWKHYEAIRRKAPGNDAMPSKATLVYESRDGLIRCFEDGEGHLSAVNAARFA